MYICDKNNNRILCWAPNACAGDCITGCSMTVGAIFNQLNSSFSIAFDSQGSLYVSDTGNNRAQKFLVCNNEFPPPPPPPPPPRQPTVPQYQA
ncbi:unnamed protein product [Rotaria socialis]|uniref:NHL repeat-containing protein n=1 Tax=Rotaria socialis TaxID=392032 RepID=A0A821NRT3_9BILA|nr:unnamed protein product [Rotaria socialis]CAF4789830.1 unnamed protein product [Rotaria socialis]